MHLGLASAAAIQSECQLSAGDSDCWGGGPSSSSGLLLGSALLPHGLCSAAPGSRMVICRTGGIALIAGSSHIWDCLKRTCSLITTWSILICRPHIQLSWMRHQGQANSGMELQTLGTVSRGNKLRQSLLVDLSGRRARKVKLVWEKKQIFFHPTSFPNTKVLAV